jgi:hypothetical protein
VRSTRKSIGGSLGTEALARLHFNVLNRDEQAQAIRQLAESGMSDDTIARATAGHSIEEIRRVVASGGRWLGRKWYPDWRLAEIREKYR